jgi:hypothetical protein
MAGLTIFVPNYKLLQSVAQRVLCWAGPTLRNRVGVDTSTTPVSSIFVPELLILTLGPLELRDSGPDVTAGYVAGSSITFFASNGEATFQDPSTCALLSVPPQILDFVVTNAALLEVELTYDMSAAGTGVFVDWGDGFIEDLSGDASGTFPHTYPLSGVYTVVVTDASDDTNFSRFQVAVPEIATVN